MRTRRSGADANHFARIQNIIGVKSLLDLAHQIQLHRSCHFFEKRSLGMTDAVLARYLTAHFPGFAIKPGKAKLQSMPELFAT